MSFSEGYDDMEIIIRKRSKSVAQLTPLASPPTDKDKTDRILTAS